MMDDGYDPAERSTYLELNRRTGTVNTVAQNQKPGTKAPAARQQAAPTPNVAQAQQRTASRRGITEADKVNMRNWGIADNEANRKEWLSNKGTV